MRSLIYCLVLVFLAAPLAAHDETEHYLGLGESMIPVDGASETSDVQPGQFFESFSGTYFYFLVSEGYESQLISMGTPPPATSSSAMPASVSVSESMSGTGSPPAAEPDPPPAVLGPYEIIGIYSYNTDTGIDVGMDCTNPTVRIIGEPSERRFRIDCPQLMIM